MELINRLAKLKRNFLAIAIILISSFSLYFVLTRLGYTVPLAYIPDVLCVNDCPDDSADPLHTPLSGDQLLNYDSQIAQIIGSQTIDKTKISILIEKSKYKLTVYYTRKPIKSYPVVFGANPVDDKLKEGDKRTPEGIFTMGETYPHPDWSKFLYFDYPTKDSWRKHIKAKKEGKIKWYDRIGSELGIHGVPTGADYVIDTRHNWTWGCISLKTKDIDELYQVVQKGTEVEIIP